MNETPELSFVIPFLNEEGSLETLYERIRNVASGLNKSYELVFVDDGSTDRSFEIADELRAKDSRVVLIRFPANRGKAAALSAGFAEAKGDIVFTMDADLQDDPAEIPNFLSKLDEGFDLVSGWKRKRHDPLEKRIPSKLFNKVTSLSTGVKLHDFNCGFKAYRRQILNEVKIYGELHRYIPPLAHWLGYRIGEIPVKHHPREHGVSKYGWERYLRGFFDLFTVVLLTKFIRNPIQFFGSIGLFLLAAGTIVLGGLTALQLLQGSILGHRPLTYLAVLGILLGSQLISLGLIAELLTAIFHRKGQRIISISGIWQRKPEATPALSVVVPIHNELENLNELHHRLAQVLDRYEDSSEIIYVDDGSIDGSGEALVQIFEEDRRANVIRHRRRFGKAAALQSGFDAAQGAVVVTMDGDLQDEPERIPELVANLGSNADMVIGRRGSVPAMRAFSSRLFNRIVSLATGVLVHDVNCGLKAFRRSSLKGVRLYGEFQRFFPILMMRKGMKLRELPVPHRERLHGVSKFGVLRIPQALLDLLTVVLLSGYLRRPLHLFGSIGAIVGLTGFLIAGWLTVLKIATGTIGGHNTLLLMSVMLMVLGSQWFATGILSELINNYFESDLEQKK